MKANLNILLYAILALALAACQKDNFKAPNSLFSGNITYQGQPLELQNGQCSYKIYQGGFGLFGPVNVAIGQEGNFSVLLYDGRYQFTIDDAQAPYQWKKTANNAPDSLWIEIKGATKQDIEVTPYYLVKNTTITNVGKQVTAKFSIQKIITDASARNIQYAQLFFNRSQFVGQPSTYNLIGLNNKDNPVSNTLGQVAAANIADLNNVTITAEIPALPTFPIQNYYFARIGLKISGIEKLIYSPVVKIQL